jgi:hypothetical protein
MGQGRARARGRVNTTTDRMLEQGKALVRAIEALETIQATGPLERPMVWLLPQAYRGQPRVPGRCRDIVQGRPRWRSQVQASLWFSD